LDININNNIKIYYIQIQKKWKKLLKTKKLKVRNKKKKLLLHI
jgi:hypothetical protein